MKRTLRSVLSVLFVVLVAYAVARGCIQKKPLFDHRSYEAPAKAIKIKKTSPKSAPKPAPIVAKAVPKPAPARSASAKMAIILDDWGMSTSLMKQAIDLKRPITLAIIPHLAHSADIAKSAKANGLGVMLHMPMQPKNLRQPKEPYTITTQTSEEEINKLLGDALATIPHVEGVNNHQGSAATSDLRVMKAVVAYLKKRKLFFVDSNVIATTVGWKVARDAGLPYAKRDVFIDNEANVESIRAQLKKAEDKALANGSVVVIGHDKRATLEAIRDAIPEIESRGIELVLAKELLQ